MKPETQLSVQARPNRAVEEDHPRIAGLLLGAGRRRDAAGVHHACRPVVGLETQGEEVMNLKAIYQSWRSAELFRNSNNEQLRIIRAQINLNPALEGLLLTTGARSLMKSWAAEFAPPKTAADREKTRIRNEQRAQAFKRFEHEDVVKSEKGETVRPDRRNARPDKGRRQNSR